jgi:hypothetical protein
MGNRQKVGVSAAAALSLLTTANLIIPVGANTGVVASAEALPGGFFGGWVHLPLSAIAGGAATATVYLAADAAGDIPITTAETGAITIGATTSTSGAVNINWNLPVIRTNQWAGDSLYMVVKLDAGTATCTVAQLFWTLRG